MRTTITAAILAIAASLAAGQPIGKGSSKGTTTSTKSSKSSSCTQCDLDTLERAQFLTNLAYGMYAPEGVITLETIQEFCSNPPLADTFLTAANDIAGCLIYPTCFVGEVMKKIEDGGTITEGDFLADAILQMCQAEESGVIVPVGGCEGATIEELCEPGEP